MALTKKAIAVLGTIVAVQGVAPGYVFLAEGKETKALLEAVPALAQVNRDMKDPADANKVAFAPTDASKAAYDAAQATPATPRPSPDTSAFVIEDNIPEPPAQAGGRGRSVYPFDKMSPGQSIAIDATAERPEPWKSLNSTIGTANGKYKALGKRFRLVKVMEGNPPKERARIFCKAVDTPASAPVANGA